MFVVSHNTDWNLEVGWGRGFTQRHVLGREAISKLRSLFTEYVAFQERVIHSEIGGFHRCVYASIIKISVSHSSFL